jgi:ketosteroid isomerase-like protein
MGGNAAIVQRLLELFPREDAVSGMRDPEALRTRLAPLAQHVSPGFEVVMVGPISAARVEYRGLDGLIAAWADWLQPFENHRTEVEEIQEAGDCVLVMIRQVATPKGAAAAVENLGATVVTFRDGLVTRIEFHLNRDEAKRSAGLPE